MVESCLVGGEICFGPRFRSLPAGLGRLKPGESYPAKTLCRQISAATAGKTQPFSLPAIRGDAGHPRKCCAPLMGCLGTGTICTSSNASKLKFITLVVCSSGFDRHCACLQQACSMQQAESSHSLNLFHFALSDSIERARKAMLRTTNPRFPSKEGISLGGAESHHGLSGRRETETYPHFSRSSHCPGHPTTS